MLLFKSIPHQKANSALQTDLSTVREEEQESEVQDLSLLEHGDSTSKEKDPNTDSASFSRHFALDDDKSCDTLMLGLSPIGKDPSPKATSMAHRPLSQKTEEQESEEDLSLLEDGDLTSKEKDATTDSASVSGHFAVDDDDDKSCDTSMLAHRPLSQETPEEEDVPWKDYCRGIANIGSTCFMASALQCLFSDHDFLNHVKNVGGPLSKELMRLAGKVLLQDHRGPVSPHAFKAQLESLAPQFKGKNMHDAHEFLTTVLDTLREELIATKDESLLASGTGFYDSLVKQHNTCSCGHHL